MKIVFHIHKRMILIFVAPTLLIEDVSGVRHDTDKFDYIELYNVFYLLLELTCRYRHVNVSVMLVYVLHIYLHMILGHNSSGFSHNLF